LKTRFLTTILLLPALTAVVSAAPGEAIGAAPFQSGERLRYDVVWPSGLTLGEATFSANAETGGWAFEAEIRASLPNFEIRENHHSRADAGLCSKELEKDAQRGNKTVKETVIFDQNRGMAERSTEQGGASRFEIPPCARDGLTYLYFLRQDLARGRIPPPDDLNFGGQYAVTVTYAESRKVEAAGKLQDSDRILVDVMGAGSSHSFEVFFGKDDARKPILIKVPFDMGTFSLRLVE